jgi:protein TonB
MINISPKNKRVILRLSISLLVSVPIIIAISCESGVLPTEDTDIVSIEATVEKSTTSVEDQVFVMVEEMAGFDGGNSNKFREYIASNLIYPKEAAEHGIQGRVFISFIVEADGSVSNVDVVRGVHTLLDNEAIRVVESSPRWTPGRQRGVAVRQSLTFPIIFTLE